MAASAITRETHQKILAYPQNVSLREIGRALGVDHTTVMKYRNVALGDVPYTASPIKETETDERDGDKRTVKKLWHKKIRTLKELSEVCEIDLGEWEIYKWKCTAWQTGMKHVDKTHAFYSQQFSVSAEMRLRRGVVQAKNIIEEIVQKAMKRMPAYPVVRLPKTQTGNMAELALADHHFGLLAWGKETGWDSWDLKLAKNAWQDAIVSQVSRIKPFGVERIVFVIGNDQQNADNRAGETERGTRQDMDGRYWKVYETSRDCTFWAIEALVGEFGCVDVVPVGGNHDPTATLHLGDAIRLKFANCKGVTVNNEPLRRKYYQWGKVMLGLGHADAKKQIQDYPILMASESPKMWGDTVWREMHLGDRHHREELKPRRMYEGGGATARLLSTLSPPSAWAAGEGHVGSLRIAESFIWNKSDGLIGTGVFSIHRDRA